MPADSAKIAAAQLDLARVPGANVLPLSPTHYTGELAVASVRSVGIDHWVTTTRH